MSLDTLSNMLSRLQNASLAGRRELELSHTKQCEAVAKVLADTGFLTEVKVFKDKDTGRKGLHLELGTITRAVRVSKPGLRVYKGNKELRPVAGGTGVLIISTSRGVMSGTDARKKKLGGEVLCKVW